MNNNQNSQLNNDSPDGSSAGSKKNKPKNHIVYWLVAFTLCVLLFLTAKPYRQGIVLGPEDSLYDADITLSESMPSLLPETSSPWRYIAQNSFQDNEMDILLKKEEQSARIEALKPALDKLLIDFPGEIGLVYYDNFTGKGLDLNPNEVFESASLVKIPIMIELFSRIHEGQLSEDTELTLEESHKTGGSGVLKEKPAGSRWSLETLAQLMICESDNTATDMLIELLGMNAIEEKALSLGLERTTLRRKIFDFDQIDKGNDNYTTPKDMFLLMEELYQGDVLAGPIRAKMLNILKKQENRQIIPRHLPGEAQAAHKTGGLLGIIHDCGIIYPPAGEPYILVMMSKNVTDEEKAKTILAEISGLIYNEIYHREDGR